ncbi:MAG: DegT/DnrJ/EryC1/StrS family aminotransferase [Pseudomonadota bacterium]
MPDAIPVSAPVLSGNEKKYLLECIDTGWISSDGPFVTRLEEMFAARIGRAYGIAVCNGTAALDIAVAALGIGQGDEVILPTFTIISCAAAVVRAGAVPVVVDCDPLTWNMDVEDIEEKITKKTKAIMVVHIYGLPVDMDPVLALAEKYGLAILEDAAEAHGLTYKGKPCGSFGRISTFSFYSNKLVTTGEGGLIATDDSVLAERCRSLRNLCFQKHRRFVHEELGWNYRMSNIQAALGVAQIERLDELLEKKKHIGKTYAAHLSMISTLQKPLPAASYAENVYWVYGLVLGDAVAFDAEAAMQELGKRGIGTRPFFWPMHEQPVFRSSGLFRDVTCPVAERIARRGFYIPSGAGLTEKQITMVAGVLRDIFN